MPKPIVAGNWKMHHRLESAREIARQVADGSKAFAATVDVVLAAPSVFLESMHHVVQHTHVGLAAQNMHWDRSGAYTGELSATMLQDVGCGWVLLGHSERRQFFGESDEDVQRKLHAALEHGLRPIVCIGESLSEREADHTMAKIAFQLRAALIGVTAEQMASVVIAYEPIWAIGTGKTATPGQAQEVHQALRALLVAMFGAAVAKATPLLYGGSIKPENFEDIMAQPDVDGGLVGGASLRAESFLQLAQIAASRSPAP